MKDFRNNIKFNYLYRDAGNYKLHGAVVFSNPEKITVGDIESLIRLRLIDGEFFEPTKWGLAPLGFEEWDDEFDHSWNEYESVEATSEEPTINKTIAKFLGEIA